MWLTMLLASVLLRLKWKVLAVKLNLRFISPMVSIINLGIRDIFHLFFRSFSGWHRQETLGKKHGTIHGNEKYLMLHIPLLLGFRSSKFQGVPQPSLIYSNKHSNWKVNDFSRQAAQFKAAGEKCTYSSLDDLQHLRGF